MSLRNKAAIVGIGALLESEDGYCKIKELKPGPALRSKKLKPGDLLMLCDVGAYGYAMSSHFLNRPRPAEGAVPPAAAVAA